MFFTGEIIAAVAAERMGLVEFCGTLAELDAHCEKFGGSVRAGSRISHAGHKRLLAKALAFSREEAGHAESNRSTKFSFLGASRSPMRRDGAKETGFSAGSDPGGV
jgi:enoyl-CoA hydratase/carnithine racemase